MFDNGCAHKVERGLKETLIGGLVDEYVDNLDPDNYPISTHPNDTSTLAMLLEEKLEEIGAGK